MNTARTTATGMILGLIVTLAVSTWLALPDQARAHDSCPPAADAKHSASHPHCSAGGGDGGNGTGSGIATNDISVRWVSAMAPNGISGTERNCVLEGKPQDTHIPYTCVQDADHPVTVAVAGGTVIGTKGSPDPNDENICNAGFSFTAYPNTQYIVGVGGEVCNDADGCPLSVHNVMYGQKDESTGYDFVKLLGRGRVEQSTNLNPWACPAGGGTGVTQVVPINTVAVSIRNGNGSKADLVCEFDVSATTAFEVTPVCP